MHDQTHTVHLAPGLRHDPQVWPRRLPALGVNALRLVVSDRAGDDHVTKTLRTVWLSAGVRPSEVPLRLAGNMPYSFEILRSGSPIIGKLAAKSCVSSMS